MSCDFTGHTHFQGNESDDAEEMDDSPPDFAAQEYFNEMAPPPMEVTAGGCGVRRGQSGGAPS